jgi:hypothetical protein
MVRKQIYLRADQDRRLKRLARELGVSEAELIRQSLDRTVIGAVPTGGDPGAWAAERRLAQSRQGKGPLPGRRDWVREEIYGRGRVSGQ